MKTTLNEKNIIFIQTLPLKAVEYLEIIGDDLYFVKDQALFKVENFSKIDYNELENKACRIKFENRKVYSIFTIKKNLFIALEALDYSKYELLCLQNNSNCGLLYPKLEEYINISNTKALCLFHNPEKTTSFIALIDINSKITNLTPNSDKVILSIAYHNGYVYANYKESKGGKIKIVAKKNILKSFSLLNKEILKGLYFKFLTKNKQLFISQDISSPSFLNLNDKSVVKSLKDDTAQINSSLSVRTTFGRVYHFFSSWRNTKEKAKTFLHIIRNNSKIILQKTDSLEYQDAFKWSGYQSHKTGNASLKDKLIFTNFYEYPLVISFQKHFSKQNLRNEILYDDDKTIIIANCIASQQKEEKAKLKTNSYNNFDLSPMNKTKYYITIDVEQHLKNIPFAITGEGLKPQCGVYLIMDILEKYGLKGVFFINIYEHKNFDGVIEKIIKDIDERGHEVALHHHANESSPWKKTIIEYSFDEQIKSLEYGKRFIEQITNKPCISFRGGAYLINQDTLKALEILGFRYDSSAFAVSKQKINYRSINKIAYYGKVLQFPVTTNFCPNYVSKIDINSQQNAQTMLDYMQTHRSAGLTHVVTMLHSFSFIRWYKGTDKAKMNALRFTANRYATGVNTALIKEFDKFCEAMSKNPEFQISTFAELSDEDIQASLKNDLDLLPKEITPFRQNNFCIICKKEVSFSPYRTRQNALCPNCKSLERMRLKFLYLERNLKIYTLEPKNILHIGPAMCVYNELKNIKQHNYISSDPFSESIYKYPLENIPFEEGYFDIVICIGVLMHVLDDDKCLFEMFRLLKRGGQMILWLGNLENENTIERYNRKDFPRMVASDFSYPQDLADGKTIELENGKLGYNPRFSTRTYGKDSLKKLEDIGFKLDLVYGRDFAGYKKYGILENDVLVIGKKG